MRPFLSSFDSCATFFLTSCASVAKILTGKECGILSIAAACLPLFHFQGGKFRPRCSVSFTFTLFRSCPLAESPCVKLFRTNTYKNPGRGGGGINWMSWPTSNLHISAFVVLVDPAIVT